MKGESLSCLDILMFPLPLWLIDKMYLAERLHNGQWPYANVPGANNYSTACLYCMPDHHSVLLSRPFVCSSLCGLTCVLVHAVNQNLPGQTKSKLIFLQSIPKSVYQHDYFWETFSHLEYNWILTFTDLYWFLVPSSGIPEKGTNKCAKTLSVNHFWHSSQWASIVEHNNCY